MKSRHSQTHIATMTRVFKRGAKPLLLAGLLATVLSACGGGSDSESAASEDAASGTITQRCAQTSGTVVVTQEGCLTEFGNNKQTVACTGTTTLHMLTGTGWTRDQLVASGSKTTAGNGQFGFNGVVLRCG